MCTPVCVHTSVHTGTGTIPTKCRRLSSLFLRHDTTGGGKSIPSQPPDDARRRQRPVKTRRGNAHHSTERHTTSTVYNRRQRIRRLFCHGNQQQCPISGEHSEQRNHPKDRICPHRHGRCNGGSTNQARYKNVRRCWNDGSCLFQIWTAIVGQEFCRRLRRVRGYIFSRFGDAWLATNANESEQPLEMNRWQTPGRNVVA